MNAFPLSQRGPDGSGPGRRPGSSLTRPPFGRGPLRPIRSNFASSFAPMGRRATRSPPTRTTRCTPRCSTRCRPT
eukprot:scaffold175978_cov28-Tisochrysis_lutea.AAC.2